MKAKLIVFLIIFFLSNNIFCQDTLYLNIHTLSSMGITLKLKNKVLGLEQGDLTTSSSEWTFLITVDDKIMSNLSVIISNTEANRDSLLLENLKQTNTYTISDNTLDTLELKNKIQIEIRNADTSLSKYTLKYNPGDQHPLLTTQDDSITADKYKVGSPVFDAIYLANSRKIFIKKKIIAYYYKNVIVTVDKRILNSKNIFLDSLAAALLSRGESENAGVSLSSALSSVGGLDITSIADAFAKFIVKRTKQELNIAFFSRFKEYISKYPDLRTVFPQTYNALSIIGDEIYNYQAYIQTLRESFENDLSTLDKNLPTIIGNHPDFFDQRPELAATLNSGCYIAGALNDKAHPGNMLQDYPETYLNGLNANWKGAIQTLQLFSASLRDTSTKADADYWVSLKQAKELVNNQTAFKIYLGLVYQEAKNKYDSIHFEFKGRDTTLVQILNSLPFDSIYKDYKDFIVRFSEKADKLNKMIKNYSKPVNDSLAYEQYYSYFNASINLIQQCTEISRLPYIKDKLPNLADSLKDYFDVAHSAGNMVLAINRRNYASAVTNAVHIYEVVKAKHTAEESLTLTKKQIKKIDRRLSKQLADSIKNSVTDVSIQIRSDTIYNWRQKAIDLVQQKNSDSTISSSNARAIARELISKAGKTDSTVFINRVNVLQTGNAIQGKLADDTLSKFYKYGTFMAAMVQAKSSDDMENAIEAFALPTGSARIKRVSGFNVSLNAYAGLFYGVERIRGLDSGNWKANVFGLASPIGVAASWGHRLLFIPTGKYEWSTSVYVSLVDLGAVAAFRFKDTVTQQVPTIQLKDIFSPGAFLSIGIPKTPLSFNLGAQVGPNLRIVNDKENEYDNNVYWRFSSSLLVDIPILNFYTKSR